MPEGISIISSKFPFDSAILRELDYMAQRVQLKHPSSELRECIKLRGISANTLTGKNSGSKALQG